MAVLALAAIVVCRSVGAALRTADGFRALLALGIAALFGIQVLLICGGTLRVLPLTGLTLPLVSSGGTSMVTTLFALGIVSGIAGSAAQRSGNPLGTVEDPGVLPAVRSGVGSAKPLPPFAKTIYTG
jgi:cell division protein FtsW (lipid II flippase)